jgi:fluoride exporter
VLTGLELAVSFLAVAVLGGAGSVVRHLVGTWGGFLPWGILMANSIASFLAGASVANGFYEIALVVGLAGGLSTFSTFAAQSYELIVSGRRARALLNSLANLLVPAGSLLIAVNLL